MPFGNSELAPPRCEARRVAASDSSRVASAHGETPPRTLSRRVVTPDKATSSCWVAVAGFQASLRDAQQPCGDAFPWAEAARLLSPHRYAMNPANFRKALRLRAVFGSPASALIRGPAFR